MNTIRELRHRHSLSQAELARLCGVHQTAVSQWESGRTVPDRASLVKLAACFNVSVDTLMRGKACADGCFLIPVLGYIRAGIPLEAVEDILDYEEISAETAQRGEHFALQIKGDSMAPRILEGDVVIVRRQEDVENGEIAVVLVNGCDATVKKISKKEQSLVLVPLNPSYEPTVYSGDEIASLPVTIIGKVVELRGKF